MLSITDLKTGATLVYRGDPFQIITHAHHKMGRGGAILRVRMRNLRTGALLEETFKGNDSFEEAQLAKRKAQYLYSNQDQLVFMDQESYEQFEIARDVARDQIGFLAEGAEVEVLLFDERPIGIILPIKVALRITETAPGFKGDTAARSYKPATTQTGATVQVPFFIKVDDRIVIDTRTGEYVERA